MNQERKPKVLQKTTQQTLSINELEQCINYWRNQYPSDPSSMTLCQQASLLANRYAEMIVKGETEFDLHELSSDELELFDPLLKG